MKKSTILICALVFVVALICANGCSTYNSMMPLDEACNKAWAEVEVQYQRRFDLIPNLVEVVKGYAKHESETFEKVTQARAGLTQAYNNAKAMENTQISDSTAFTSYTDAQADLNRAFNIYVNAVTEAYPDLKANTQFQDLQVQLEGTENRIATARRNYTEAVNDYNIKVRHFPGSLWAGMFGFSPKPQFRAEEAAQSAPKVSF